MRTKMLKRQLGIFILIITGFLLKRNLEKKLLLCIGQLSSLREIKRKKEIKTMKFYEINGDSYILLPPATELDQTIEMSELFR